VLYGYRTTALTWALERSAWSLARVTRFWDPNYYRTYLEQDGQPDGFMSVQQEVTRALARAEDFIDVPATDPDYRRKTSGLQRDTIDDARPALWCGIATISPRDGRATRILSQSLCRDADRSGVSLSRVRRAATSCGAALLSFF
jgi:hypothetical protein